MNCACGCNSAVLPGRTYLQGHNSRVAPNLRPTSGYLIDENGCWNWQGRLNPDGYGHVKRNNRTLRAHRAMWEAINGPIADGLELDHLCSNRACVNPAHLEPVTRTENIRRSLRTKLTPDDVVSIRAAWKKWGGGVRHFLRETAPHYGVSHGAIEGVIAGRTWRDVVDPADLEQAA
jgi:hypothetical protein